MHADIVFISPWRPLEFDLERAALPKQLAIEISRNHPLWRRECTVIGRADDNDDILVACSDGTFAIVHLVWSNGPGDETYPTTTIYPSAQSVNDAIWREAAFFGSIEDVDWNDERLRPSLNRSPINKQPSRIGTRFKPLRNLFMIRK